MQRKKKQRWIFSRKWKLENERRLVCENYNEVYFLPFHLKSLLFTSKNLRNKLFWRNVDEEDSTEIQIYLFIFLEKFKPADEFCYPPELHWQSHRDYSFSHLLLSCQPCAMITNAFTQNAKILLQPFQNMNDLQGFLSQWTQNLPQSAAALSSSCQILNRRVAWGIRGPVFIWRPTATSEDLTWMAQLLPVFLLGQINTNLNPLWTEKAPCHIYIQTSHVCSFYFLLSC